jgi:hypothetical protein
MPEEPNTTPNPLPEVEPASGSGMPAQQPEDNSVPVRSTPPLSQPPQSPVTQLMSEDPQPQPAPTPTPTPAPVEQAEPSQPVLDTPAPKKSGKKKFVIASIIIAALALLGGGGAYAYFGWYQNPDKVIADSLANTLSSTPGSVKMNASYKAGDTGVSLSVDAKGNDKIADATLSFEYASTTQKIDLKSTANMVATENGTVYLKFNKVRELAEKAVDAMVESSAAQYKQFGYNLTESQIAQQKKAALTQYEPVIAKIDNKWIKFSADSKSTTSEDQKCAKDAIAKLKTDSAYRNEIGKVYADNKFVVIKEQLGLKNGSYGYVLELDQDKTKAFGKAAESTQFAKDLKKCSGSTPSSSSSSSSSSDKFKNTRVELWVSQWSHQVTGLKVSTTYEDTQSADLTFDLTIGYDKAGNISEPTDAIDSQTLMNDIYGAPSAPVVPVSI